MLLLFSLSYMKESPSHRVPEFLQSVSFVFLYYLSSYPDITDVLFQMILTLKTYTWIEGSPSNLWKNINQTLIQNFRVENETLSRIFAYVCWLGCHGMAFMLWIVLLSLGEYICCLLSIKTTFGKMRYCLKKT